MQKRDQREVREAAAAPAEAATPVPRERSPAEARAASVIENWNGWDHLPKDAVPEFDADGYIYADGRRVNARHYSTQVYVYSVLASRYRARDDVAVQGDIALNFTEGDRTAFVGPDVLVAFGAAPDPDLTSHKTWERGVPRVVVEILSESTRNTDLGPKRDLYESLGVSEYVLYDPWGRRLPGRLRICRLVGESYVDETLPEPPPLAAVGGSGRSLHSEELGLEFRDVDGDLRLRDRETGEDLLDYEDSQVERLRLAGQLDESEAARVRAELLAQHERARAEAAEARIAEAARERAAAEARVKELEKLLRERTAGGAGPGSAGAPRS